MLALRCVCACAALSSFALPARAEGSRAPREAYSRPDARAVSGGLVLFGLAYGAAVVIGARHDFQQGTRWLPVPVAGPWAALADGTRENAWGLAADGIAQLGGALITTAAFVYPRRVLGPASGSTGPKVAVVVVPAGGPAVARDWSLALRGSF